MSFESPSSLSEPSSDAARQPEFVAVPESFEKDNEKDVFGPEYMQGLSPEERREVMVSAFTHKVMDWLESSESDPKLEESIRQSDLGKETARFASLAYVEQGWITREQRAAKLAEVGVTDLSDR